MLKLSSTQAEQMKSIGAYLQQKRLEKTLTLEDIAAITMIRPPILQALEEGIFEQLPELVYVKGFIRRYGDVLKIDGSALATTLAAIPETEVSEAPEEPKTVPVKSKEVATPEWVMPVKSPSQPSSSSKTLPALLSLGLGSLFLGLGGLALIGLGYYYYSSRSQPAAKPTPQTAPTVVKASPAVVAPPSPVVVEPSPSPVATAAPLSITVKLDDRSWLEIFVDGELGYRGTLEAGEEKTWTAKKAFNIKAGNAGAVKISVNEKPPKPLGKLGEVKEVTLTANTN